MSEMRQVMCAHFPGPVVPRSGMVLMAPEMGPTTCWLSAHAAGEPHEARLQGHALPGHIKAGKVS